MPRAWFMLFLALLLVGCAPEEVKQGGARGAGPPHRVVSLSPSTTEIVGSNDLGGQLVGRSSACNFPTYVNPPQGKGLPVYAGVKPDYEKLAQDKPDLVVYDGAIYNDADKAKLKELGLRLFELNAKSVDDFITQVRELGVLLGSPMPISIYVDKIRAERAAAQSQAPKPTPKLAALTGTGNDHLIAGTRGFVADAIRSGGGEPVGPDADRFVPLNPETLIQQNPDIVVIATDIDPKNPAGAASAVKSFLADPRFRAVKAVQTGRVYPINADILLRTGWRVDKLINGLGAVIREGKR